MGINKLCGTGTECDGLNDKCTTQSRVFEHLVPQLAVLSDTVLGALEIEHHFKEVFSF